MTIEALLPLLPLLLILPMAGFLFTALGNEELLTVSAIMSIGAILGAGLIWMLPMRDADREADERAAT